VSNNSSWDKLIPADEARVAIEFLDRTWKRLIELQPDKVRYSEHEPKLTERLCSYLSAFRAESGLLGFWGNENQSTFYDENGELENRIKKDIIYQSNVAGNRIELVFEFKKLSRSSVSAYLGKDGMRRFVDGNYSIGQPLALMVGITKDSSKQSVNAICKSLEKPSVRSELEMVPNDVGNYIRRPSVAVEKVAVFDTEHRRSPDKAPYNGKIILAHMFLECGK